MVEMLFSNREMQFEQVQYNAIKMTIMSTCMRQGKEGKNVKNKN